METFLHPAQIAAYRRMTYGEKMRQAELMYWSARALKTDAVRRANPSWTEGQVEAEVRQIFLYARS